MSKATAAILNHHLEAFREGVDALLEDYTEDSVLMTPGANYEGLTEIRVFFTAFLDSLPEGLFDAFKISRQEVLGNVAYVVWQAKPWIPLGTDTLIIKGGKIALQTFAAHAVPV